MRLLAQTKSTIVSSRRENRTMMDCGTDAKIAYLRQIIVAGLRGVQVWYINIFVDMPSHICCDLL